MEKIMLITEKENELLVKFTEAEKTLVQDPQDTQEANDMLFLLADYFRKPVRVEVKENFAPIFAYPGCKIVEEDNFWVLREGANGQGEEIARERKPTEYQEAIAIKEVFMDQIREKPLQLCAGDHRQLTREDVSQLLAGKPYDLVWAACLTRFEATKPNTDIYYPERPQ